MNEIVRDERAIAMEINAIKGQARAMLISSAIEIGKRLCEAKEMVPRGGWIDWLKENVDYSERTAQNLMRCWEEYGKKDKAQALADVSLTSAVALLGAAPAQRDELIASGEAAALSTRELEARIAELKARDEARQLRLDELLAQAEEVSAREAEAEERERTADAARESALAAQAEAMKAVEERDGLKERIAALEAQNADRADEIKNLREKAKADRQHAKLAEERAREAEKRAGELEAREPETIEVEKRVEVVPEEVSAELERLRAVAAKAPSEAVIRLRDGYARALKEFEAVREILDGMEPGEAAKYRAAMAEGLRKMGERIGGAA